MGVKKYSCVCKHTGCREVFNSRMQRIRHDRKCSKPIDEVVENSPYTKIDQVGYLCKKCNAVIKHRNFRWHENKCKIKITTDRIDKMH